MKKVKGDLLKKFDDGEFDIIVHGCNCQNDMGGGIAAMIAKRYPKAQEADSATEVGSRTKHGTVQLVWLSGWLTKHLPFFFRPKIVINAYTQYLPGANASINAVDFAFNDLANTIKAAGLEKMRIGIPAIGCGIGGLAWADVEKSIDAHTSHLDITLVEYAP